MKTVAPVLLAAAAASAAQAADGRCDRACLVTIANRYMVALVDHKPDDAPLAPNVSFTENGVPAKIGEGSWLAAKGIRPQRQYVSDVVGGQVGVMAIMDGADDRLQTLAFRLKLDANRRISEIESIWSQDGNAGNAWLPEMFLYREAPYVREVPAKNRNTRAELSAVDEKYWKLASTTHKGYDMDYGHDCLRFENGMNTTWESELSDEQKKMRDQDIVGNAYVPDSESGLIWTCQREMTLSTRGWSNARDRHLVIDEERGLVLTFAAVDGAGGNGPGGPAAGNAPPGAGGAGGPPGGAGGPPGGAGGAPGGAVGRPAQIGTMIAGSQTMFMGPPGISVKGMQLSRNDTVMYQAQLSWIIGGKVRREQVFMHVVPNSKETK